MEDPNVVSAEEDEEPDLAVSPSSGSLLQDPMRPGFSGETVIEKQAVSIANNDCSPALSSPAEASPARPAVTLPTNTNGIAETSPTTSDIASASDSLTSTGTCLVDTSTVFLPPLLPVSQLAPPSNPLPEKSFPAELTFKGVSVTLANDSVWTQFHNCGTEMILTKQGRRMFPSCSFRLAGLEPTQQYNLVLSIVPADQHKYRWNAGKWEVFGPAEHQTQGLIRAFPHHHSPCLGSEWMSNVVSFYKLKLTNNIQDRDGHIILHSLHRYIPRLHVIPVPDGGGPTPDQPMVKGPESMAFTFPQTEFTTVTSYQNIRITQLKINHNPFAKSLRVDGQKFLVNRIRREVCTEGNADAQPPDLKPAGSSTSSEEVVDLSTKKHEAETQAKRWRPIKSKPLTDASATKEGMDVDDMDSGHPHTQSARGKRAHPCKRLSLDSLLASKPEPCPVASANCEVVFLPKAPPLQPREENNAVSVTPKVASKPQPTTPTSSRSARASSPGYPKKRRRINRHWGNSRGREVKAEVASSMVVHSPSLTVAMQPELDDVEGLLFVSFTSKEALGIHVGDKPASSPTPVSPVSLTPQSQLEQTAVEEVRETDEEKIARLQAVLLQDIRALKHRQVIHPVLQEVGLKLSSLDPTKAIDLRYLGVHLPLPPPVLPGQADATALSAVDEALSFVSRTGKTSDMTKIKGWRDKFIRSKETSPPKRDGSQKDLSAFCSNMLDEYLESEAQQISERAAAFSTIPGSSVAYQLPAKSSSYVKTLDSVLKHRKAASKFLAPANRPCPLSHKPLLYSVLTSPTPPLVSPATSVQAAAKPKQQLVSPPTKPRPLVSNKSPETKVGAKAEPGSKVAPGASFISQGSPPYNPWFSQKPGLSGGQGPGVPYYRPPGHSKVQFKLLEMEKGALSQGLGRTHLTPDRLSVALSVILTAKMLPSQRLSVPQYRQATGPECGRAFCRLGCVCSSLRRLNRGPLHCRRPDCMFGCACFKRKITKQTTAGEAENPIQRVYSVTNVEHEVQPSPGSHSDTLWDRSTALLDPEPLFIPKTAVRLSSPAPPSNKRTFPRIVQPMREGDKDPVYKYLESMMTCARVREFNNKPHPEVPMPFKNLAARTPSTKTGPQKTPNTPPQKTSSNALAVKNAAGKISMLTKSKESEPSKRMEIQSACQWDKDHKKVLEALCRRMKQNNLSLKFYIGPYLVRLLSKIYMRKSSGSSITYKVNISKPKNDEDKSDYSDDEDEQSDNSSDEDREAVEEDRPAEVLVGVTPFLSGVLPAGKLRARKKPRGRQALVQVNGKSYTQARLLLGSMGSLHPANRVAAYVTGRLSAATKFPQNSQNPEAKHKICTPATQRLKAAGAIAPPVIAARKITVKTTTKEPPGQRVRPAILRKGSGTSSQPSPEPPAISPLMKFVTGQHGSIAPSQNSSSSSPVSLTVSRSFKTPSFLGQSGTYSFRICPPNNQSSRGPGQSPPGVTLPGGFTLIQLPKPGVDGAFVQPAEIANTTNTTSVAKSPASSDVGEPGLAPDHNYTGTKDLPSVRSAEPGSSPELMCDEKMPSDESDDAENDKSTRQVESDLDMGSEDMTSESSDYDGEDDEDDETVDIETVEETTQRLTITKMKAAASRYSSEDSGSAREHVSTHRKSNGKKEPENGNRRVNHKVLERLRRSEQRYLFGRLQNILHSDPRTPKLRVLAMALSEIQTLVETSKRLEEKKRMLTQMQSLYIKDVSRLSGKPEDVIKMKLKEIYQRKKLLAAQRMVPLSSYLRHQSITTVPKGTAHQPRLKPQPMSLSHPKIPVAYASTPAQITTSQPRPKPQVLPQAVLTPAQATEPRSQVEDQPRASVASVLGTELNQPKIKDQPEASPQVAAPQSQMEDQFQAPLAVAPPQVTTPHSQKEVQFQAPSASAPPQVVTSDSQMEDQFQGPSARPISPPQTDLLPQAAICSPQPVTLPLIRSKTGRIILPSSLKPAGQGYYTLMVMGANQEGEESEVSSSPQTLPSDLESSKDQETISSESEQPLDSSEEGKNLESSHILEEVKNAAPRASRTAKSSKVATKRQGAVSPLVELARLNKSIYLPSIALHPVEKSLEGSRMLGMDKNPGTACLSFKPLSPPYVESEPSPPVVRRGRGRPRKHVQSVIPVNQDETISLVEETKTQAEDSLCKADDVVSSPPPVKRGRGRPPKKKRVPLESPAAGTRHGPRNVTLVSSSPVTQAGSSPAKASQPVASPVRFTRSVKSPETQSKDSPAAALHLGGITESRPVTRGALGKDFPSAKKRSWIDIEKELEPE